MNTEKQPQSNNPLVRRILRIGILVLALFLIVFGLFQGGFGEVLAKAVRICYECIGIG